jgi:hypothetical protein
MQPVLTQVPPSSLRSTSATFMPAPVSRPASDGPAWPAPMMMASKVVMPRTPSAGLLSLAIPLLPIPPALQSRRASQAIRSHGGMPRFV